jgi:hypothetical protein
MKLGLTLVLLVTLVLGFQNCSKDLGAKKSESNNSQLGSPSPGPAPGPGPGPFPGPGGTLVQPNPTNSMADAKPYNSAVNCPNGYGVYSLLQTSPALPGNWNHNLCVKLYSAGDTSVLADTQMVSGSACAAGWDLLETIPSGGTMVQPGFTMNYSICVKRTGLPVTGKFITYFYLSAPDGPCRTNDTGTGDAIFCSQAGPGGCTAMVTVKLCRSVQN